MVLYAYMCCVYVFSLRRESLNITLGDKPLIFEVVLSHTQHEVTLNMRMKIMKLLKHFRFMFERLEPCKLTKIINKGNIIIIVVN
jgi:hypothetical protein